MANRRKRSKGRKTVTAEEKMLKALHGLFILHAAELQMSGSEIRKILGIGMSEVTPILKSSIKAIKKSNKEKQKP